jgi:AcrR family transcriptional regulator
MRAAKADRRTERTRAALMSAFNSLLLSEGYEDVTVERVAERANIGRSTFYMHYSGKEDILKQSLARPSSPLANLVGSDAAPEELRPILEHFREQKARNRIFFVAPLRPLWVKCLAGMIEPRIAAVSRHAHGRPVLPLPLIALHLAEAQIALVANWLMGNCAVKPEAIAEALIETTRASLCALLRGRPGAALFIPDEK